MRFTNLPSIIILLFLMTSVLPAWGFDGHIVQEGPLKLIIHDVKLVTDYELPQDVEVTLTNSSDKTLSVKLRMAGLVDEWYAVGETVQSLEIESGKEETATFRIAAGKGAYSALYPVHIYADFSDAGRSCSAHAIQIFESNFKKPVTLSTIGEKIPLAVVSESGAVRLDLIKTHRVCWQYLGKEMIYMPIGWEGSVTESGASFTKCVINRGTTKKAINMHPVWGGGPGAIFTEYYLQLPITQPIQLVFANAIRDHTAQEPPSDGVMVFERHTDSKTWVNGQVDLSRFAGEKIVLRLESNPGPQNNTTCDASFWAEPMIITGKLPEPFTQQQKETLQLQARQIVAGEKTNNRNEFLFALDDGYSAGIVLGPNGIIDAAIAIGKSEKCVLFNGIQIAILGLKLGGHPPQIPIEKVEAQYDRTERTLRIRHVLQHGTEQENLVVKVWPDRSGLRIQCECEDRITDLALGHTDQKAPRLYYGHGYCIEDPQTFQVGYGGHTLSTSHVGFDFEKGISILTACDNPPDFLEVNSAANIYALHTHMNAILTIVPSEKGAFDCAFKYREIDPRQPSPGFSNKAGRFVFDIWWGRHVDNADMMKRMIEYGLTDSLLTLHGWQRWGYDYRLPDIYPPEPSLGTVEEMRQIGIICEAQNIPWGMHDNYIDFYPDADGYSYDHISFTESGEPVKAWYHEGRNAQSYRWRPDHFTPFMQRNLKLIKENLKPTHYFIDVFTSIDLFDFYDRTGEFHSMLETRKNWGETFRWIQDYLGGAVTSSEAGDDQLVGYLDGADCQFLRLTTGSESHCFRVPCRDWQRVPWYDAVLHDKFSLHGVGYSSRYQGDQPRMEHGIESDDYINTEILTGHSLMIDRDVFAMDLAGQGAVRKYWLAQDFIRSIAADRIQSVEFHEDNIHRQIITWQNGAKVYVNRSKSDWTVAGKILPEYGFYATNGEIQTSIEKIQGQIVEQSNGPGRYYVNGRGFNLGGALAIQPIAEKLEYLGERKFKLLVDWQVNQILTKDAIIFLHFKNDKSNRSDKIAFQGDQTPEQGTSTWQGTIHTGADGIIEIPRNCEPGEYKIIIGLYEPATGYRYLLDGREDGERGIYLGKIVAEGQDSQITNVRLIDHQQEQDISSRWNRKRISIDFGPTLTYGAFRCEIQPKTITITPLPGLEPFAILLQLDKIAGNKKVKVDSVTAIDAEQHSLEKLEFNLNGSTLKFQTRKDAFAYQINLS
jgi:hypothetical protein